MLQVVGNIYFLGFSWEMFFPFFPRKILSIHYAIKSCRCRNLYMMIETFQITYISMNSNLCENKCEEVSRHYVHKYTVLNRFAVIKYIKFLRYSQLLKLIQFKTLVDDWVSSCKLDFNTPIAIYGYYGTGTLYTLIPLDNIWFSNI